MVLRGDVYGLPRMTYPPGTYALLFPSLGWNNIDTARWLWAGLSLLLCIFLVRTVWREVGIVKPAGRTRWAFLVLAMASVSVTIGNGQVGLWVLVVLLAAISRMGKDVPSGTLPVTRRARDFHHGLLNQLEHLLVHQVSSDACDFLQHDPAKLSFRSEQVGQVVMGRLQQDSRSQCCRSCVMRLSGKK